MNSEGLQLSTEVFLSGPSPGICQITLNRPEKLNAMNVTLVQGLYRALDVIEADKDCRIVILTGAGRGFCAGVDLGGYGTIPGHEALGRVQHAFAVQQQITGLVPRLRRLPQPVIAAVNGPATGGGLALVAGSDIRLASESAKFNAAFIRIGLSGCDIGLSWLLPRLVGAGRAHELMLTGRIFDAEEAARIGLVLNVVPDEDLLQTALEMAELVLRNSPMAVRMTKEVMWSALEIPSQQAVIDLENRTQVMLLQTNDFQEAMRAFVEGHLE